MFVLLLSDIKQPGSADLRLASPYFILNSQRAVFYNKQLILFCCFAFSIVELFASKIETTQSTD